MSSLRTIRIDVSGGRLRRSVGGERDERQRARALDGLHDLPLVLGAGPRDAPREDLRALGRERLHQAHVLVINEGDLLIAELAELLLPEQELLLERLLAAPALP